MNLSSGVVDVRTAERFAEVDERVYWVMGSLATCQSPTGLVLLQSIGRIVL